MDFIKIEHLSKAYKTSEKTIEVLKDVSFVLPQSGLVVILGKSGSGKSTLLNIIGSIDKPTKGNIKTLDIAYRYTRNGPPLKYISFIFQHYHLLENETPLYNVMLPGLIRGNNKKLVEKQARELFALFNLDEKLINKETRLLSGGEKERIAILRALITDPQLILADEPTGALDAQNAVKTMDILKKASETRLVLLVTHNNKLAREYADRIITLADGRIVNDEVIHENKEEIYRSKVKFKSKSNWTNTLINHNFKKRLKRNVVSIVGMTISLIFCYLLFGFVAQSDNAINAASERHFDYGTCVVQKEIATQSSSSLSLIKTLRPSKEEIDDIQTKFPEFEIMPNYDAIFGVGQFYIGNKKNNTLNHSYILNFDSNCFDKELVISGDVESGNNWNDIIVNPSAYELIKNDEVHYKLAYEHKAKAANGVEVIDYFELDEKLNIIAVVDEFDFLSVPKIYFDYTKVDSLLENYELENYSEYKTDATLKSLVINSEDGDDISSFSVRCMLKDIKDKSKIEELKNYLSKDINLDNDSLTIKEALMSLTLAASYGLEIFLVIAIAGSVLIVGVFSYSAYVDDKKESSILSCLGARNSDIVSIFASESLIVTFIAFLFSSVFSLALEKPVNAILTKLIDIPDLIKIPFKSFTGIKGILPLGIFLGSVLVTLIFSSIPILINKSVSIKKELADL